MKSQVKSRRNLGAATAVALSVALLATACGGSGSSGSSKASSGSSTSSAPIVIRGVLAQTSDPFWRTLGCGASAQAKARGIDFKWFESSANDATVLTTNFNTALLDKPQGVLLDAPSVQQFSAQVIAQQAKGVVFSNVVGMTPPTYHLAIADQESPPEVIALAQSVIKGGGSVMTLGGSAAVPILQNRYRRLLEKLRAVPGANVLPVQYDNFDATKAQVDVNAAIIAHPDLKLIFSSNGADTPGVLAALKQANRQDIKVIVADATPSAVEALRAGTILAIQALPALEAGQVQIDALVDFITKHPNNTTPVTETTETIIKVRVLTKANVDDAASQGLFFKTTCS